jgi:hypothetical protein
MLAQRKNLEKHIINQFNRKYQLDEMLMGIEAGESNKFVMESLKKGKDALDQSSTDISDLESIMGEI